MRLEVAMIQPKYFERILPTSFTLYQNYPNPFNPITTIKYDLPIDSEVKITIFNIVGEVVTNLINTHQKSGYKSIQWNATNDKVIQFHLDFIFTPFKRMNTKKQIKCFY